MKEKQLNVACIVAHPDDETLWAGGTIMSHPSWKCFVVSVFRGNDADSPEKFKKALNLLNAAGVMGTNCDSPEQMIPDEKELKRMILKLLPPIHFDIIISHHPSGECKGIAMNEAVGRAVIKLWNTKKVLADELWNFAYEDGNSEYYPEAINPASSHHILSEKIWMKKYKIITETYGFGEESWEAETTPRAEAFWKTNNLLHAKKWLLPSENEII